MPIIYESYSKSPERAITGQKKPSSIGCSLWDEGRTKRLEGTTQWVETKIQVNVDLWDRTVNYTPLPGKTINIYHRLDTGAPEVIFSGKPNAPDLGPNWYKLIYTLAKAGAHTFYAEFPGDDVYAGCGKAVRTFAR